MLNFCRLLLLLGCLFMQNNVLAATSTHLKTETRAAEAAAVYSKLNPGKEFYLSSTDREFSELAKKYIYSDIATQTALSLEERELITVATLITLQLPESMLINSFEEGLNAGVSPVTLRESVYQLAPYIGIARVIVALEGLNRVFSKRKITLPEEQLSTTTDTDRFEKGLQFQVDTYGERISKMREATPDYQKHLQDDLSAFCFGDVYTRKGLNLKQREFLTVAAIGALGIEAQFKSHVAGTLAAGGTREEVIGVITAMNPYIGFPRTLNLLRFANEVFTQTGQAQK